MPTEVAQSLRAEGLLRSAGPHAPNTVKRRLASWSTLHRWKGIEGPFAAPSLRAALRLAVRASPRGRVHTDKEADGHIHAHAVIAVKSESGQKLHPSRQTFSEWRQAYAQHAQAEGLKIVATSARERASSQSYGPKDKSIVDAAERPRPTREARDRAYAADPANRRLIDNARQRIQVARTNPIRLPVSVPDRRAVNESVLAWKAVAVEQPGNQ